MNDSNSIITALLNGKPFRHAKYSSDDLKKLLHEVDRRRRALMREFPLGAAIAEASRPTSYSASFPSYYREPPSPESVEFLKLKDLQTQIKLELHRRGELEELRIGPDAKPAQPQTAHAESAEPKTREPASPEELEHQSARDAAAPGTSQAEPSRAQNGDEVTEVTEAAAAKERAAFLRPILEKKGFSVNDWAIRAGVDFHTANNYLHGHTTPYQSTLTKLAGPLGIEVKDMPA